MQRQALVALMLLCLGATRDDAQRAEQTYQAKAQDAERAYRQSILSAKRIYRNELSRLLPGATRGGDLDAANRVKRAVDDLDVEIKDLETPNKSAIIAGLPLHLRVVCLGNGDDWVDITAPVLARAKDGKPVGLGNDLAGHDPAPFRRKSSILIFNIAGTDVIIELGEEAKVRFLRPDQLPAAVREGNLKPPTVKEPG